MWKLLFGLGLILYTHFYVLPQSKTSFLLLAILLIAFGLDDIRDKRKLKKK